MESVQRVARVVKDEEHRYATTFLVAEKFFNDEVKHAQRARHSRRDFVQALRHLRPGARRAGRHGARARPVASTAKASIAEMEQQRERAPRQLERRGKRRDRSGLSEAARAGPHQIPGLQRTAKPRRASIGLLVDSSWWSAARWRRSASWCSTKRPSMPKPAARSATAARFSRDTGEKVADGGNTSSPAFPASPCIGSSRSRRSASAMQLRAEVAVPLRACHHAQSHRHASAARRAAPGAGHAREAGRQRGRARRACASISPTTPRWTTPKSTKSSG